MPRPKKLKQDGKIAVVLTVREAFVIRKLRKCRGYGKLSVNVFEGKPQRVEYTVSEIVDDLQGLELLESNEFTSTSS